MKRILLSQNLRFVLLSTIFLFNSRCDDHRSSGENARYFGKDLTLAIELKARGDTVAVDSMITALLDKISGVPSIDQAKAYKFLAEYALQQKKYQLADRYINNIQQVLNSEEGSAERDFQYAESYLLKGDVLFAQGLYSYAFQYYYKSRRQMNDNDESEGQHAFMVQYNQRQGMIAYKQENFAAAVTHYKQVLKELRFTDHRPFGYVYETQGALSNLSISFLKQNLPDSALHYYNLALDVLHEAAPYHQDQQEFIKMAQGVIVGNMGDAWMMKKVYERAEQLYLEDIAINDRSGRYQQDALMTKLKLAKLYMRTNRLKQAGQLLALAGRSPDLADPESMINFLMTRADYAEATGQYRQVISDLRRRSALRDSVQQARRKLLSANMEGIFKLMEVEHEKEMLENSDHLKTYATILIGAMAVVIALLFSRNVQIARKRTRDTEARNAELQLALNALEMSNEENLRFSQVLAHDIRNPVHALSMIITLMHNEERSEEDQEMLGLAKESIMKINLIVEDILEQKKEADADQLERQNCDLAALLRHSVALLRFKAAEKKQKIQETIVKTLSLSIDQHKIWRVLNNILVNAIKFSPESTTVWVVLKVADNTAIISVRDEGIGIPDELREVIFSGSKVAQRTGTGGEASFGIGLYASRQIIEAHGGTITFNSPVQGGTEFIIRLPV